jgi:serine/threonine-protein kinase
MGSVYKAEQPGMDRMVAIKILHPKLTNRQDLASRFRREARAMAQLSHPNTVKVFTYGELDDGSLYIVMEFLEGRNMNRAVKRGGPMAPERAVAILIQVCGALQEAHSAGIIHRDLKPENIFLCKQMGVDDYPKVLDFGLAKVTEQQMRPGSVNLTQEGMVFGTPEFMSPEQAQGKPLEATSDIYSLAVILYEALTGKLPFDAKNPVEFIQKHVIERPIPLDDRVPGLAFPPGLGDAIAVALRKEPIERYQSAIEFAAALRPFAGTLAPLVDGIFQLTPAPAGVAGALPRSSPRAAPGPRGASPSLVLLATVAAVCLVIGVVLAIVIMKVLGK